MSKVIPESDIVEVNIISLSVRIAEAMMQIKLGIDNSEEFMETVTYYDAEKDEFYYTEEHLSMFNEFYDIAYDIVTKEEL